MARGVADLHLRILPYTMKHAYGLFDLPLDHADPFDRQTIAQALAEGLPVVTSHRASGPYREIEVLWGLRRLPPRLSFLKLVPGYALRPAFARSRNGRRGQSRGEPGLQRGTPGFRGLVVLTEQAFGHESVDHRNVGKGLAELNPAIRPRPEPFPVEELLKSFGFGLAQDDHKRPRNDAAANPRIPNKPRQRGV